MKILVSIGIIVLACMANVDRAYSQTNTRVTAIQAIKNQGTIDARLHVVCDSAVYYTLNPAQLEVTDNGLPVQNIRIISTPSPQTRKPFSAVLVLDVSGSMFGAGIANLKTASHALVDFLDSTTDELEIISFNSVARIRHPMTSFKNPLRNAIDSLGASGATAVWDAAYLGVQELISNAQNSSQAVVVMTDGGDNSSSRTPADIITLANTNNRRVFTIGLGNLVNGQTLDTIAQQTGGLYFQTPSAQDLQQIFLQIASFARRDFDEYTIRFDTPDSKADKHTVTVTAWVCDTVLTGSATRPSMQGTTGIGFPDAPSAGSVTLFPTYPNPLRGDVLDVRYMIHESNPSGTVTCTLIDALGRCRAEYSAAPGHAGEYRATLTTRDLAAGNYVLWFRYNGESRAIRVVLAR